MKKIIRQKNKGFTLVETLVAISIFTVSILALMSVLTKGIANTNYAKTRVGASYLAQEGIEFSRNLRDTFVLYDATDAQTGWSSFKNKLISGGCVSNNGCYFDSANLNYSDTTQPILDLIVTACASSCPPLLYDPATGRYGYVSGQNSGLTRKIRLDQINTNEVKITSGVYWAQGSGSYNITFSENLFNWVE